MDSFIYNSKDIMNFSAEYKIVDYYICYGSGASDLSRGVNDRLKDNYTLYGTVFVKGDFMYQPMIKVEKI